MVMATYTEPADLAAMGKTVGMGLGVVFVGLICIIFICAVMSVVVRAFEKKQPEVTKESAAEPANRGELSAVIAAAIAETMGTDISGLRIVSVKKVN